jgi:hypothetical protein
MSNALRTSAALGFALQLNRVKTQWGAGVAREHPLPPPFGEGARGWVVNPDEERFL